MKILINTPSLRLLGGVANHYVGLRAYWKEMVIYNTVGKRSHRDGSGKYWLPWDILKFIFRILSSRPDIVLLNPSLSLNAVKRDFIFLRIAKLLGKRCVLFFHGFNLENIEKIGTAKLCSNLSKCDGVIVLAHKFREIVASWGVTAPIYLSTTKVDDRLIESFEIESRRSGEISTILFLARVTRNKGIFITLESFKQTKSENPNLKLRIVGGGEDLAAAKEYCRELQIEGDVEFTGPLRGEQLIEEFKQADLYLLPTFHYEGMPTSVLEAMAFGLPIISRPVGGLVDIFTDKMGLLVESLEAADYAQAMQRFISDKELSASTARYNHNFAKQNFMASKVAMSVESTLREINNRVER